MVAFKCFNNCYHLRGIFCIEKNVLLIRFVKAAFSPSTSKLFYYLINAREYQVKFIDYLIKDVPLSLRHPFMHGRSVDFEINNSKKKYVSNIRTHSSVTFSAKLQ